MSYVSVLLLDSGSTQRFSKTISEMSKFNLTSFLARIGKGYFVKITRICYLLISPE